MFIVFSVSTYRRKHIELYSSHDLFRKENSEAAEIRQLSAQEAQDDATKWLQDGGDVAVSIICSIHLKLIILYINICILYVLDIGWHSYNTSSPPSSV